MHRASLVGMVSSSSVPRRREHPVAAQEHQKIFISPEEGAHLPVLDIVHKVTAQSSGGTLSILEWGLPPGQMIPPAHPHLRGRVQRGVEGPADVRRRRRDRGGPGGLLRAQAAGGAPRLVQYG